MEKILIFSSQKLDLFGWTWNWLLGFFGLCMILLQHLFLGNPNVGKTGLIYTPNDILRSEIGCQLTNHKASFSLAVFVTSGAAYRISKN